MVGPWPHRAFTFRALSKTYGQMWLRCDVCRRYVRLKLAGLHDVDYRTKTFSCSVCGRRPTSVWSSRSRNMAWPTIASTRSRSPSVIRMPKRLTEPPRRTVSSAGGELPGRKIDGRR
jgi:hypothetical protein